MDAGAKERWRQADYNAKTGIVEKTPVIKDGGYFQRKANVPPEPIWIASSVDVGTNRVRANHVDACIDYCEEQITMKRIGAPIVPYC